MQGSHTLVSSQYEHHSMLDVTSHQNHCFAIAVDETSGGEGAQAKGQPAGQGAVGWAVNTASSTVGFGKSLTEVALRGVGRTTGTAVSIASRASEAILVLCIDFFPGSHLCSAMLHCSTIHAFTKTSAVRSSAGKQLKCPCRLGLEQDSCWLSLTHLHISLSACGASRSRSQHTLSVYIACVGGMQARWWA